MEIKTTEEIYDYFESLTGNPPYFGGKKKWVAVDDVINELKKYKVKTGCILLNETAFKVLEQKLLNSLSNENKKEEK